jgi:predicted ATPase/DNA-binding SARP family transcriptional activator
VSIRLLLLGSPRLSDQDLTLPVDKPASLAYYLSQRGDWVSRNELAFLYRPDVEEAVALEQVRKLLYRLRKHAWASGIEIEKYRVRFRVTSDVQEFRQAMTDHDWARALGLYGGPFLDGVNLSDVPGYGLWLDLERSDLARAWQQATRHHAQQLEQAGNLIAAAMSLEALLRHDPLDEEAVRAYLSVLNAQGQRQRALEVFEAFRLELRELDAEPLEATQALIETIRQGDVSPQVLAHSSVVRHNLVAPTTRFVGRKRELARLSQALAEPDGRLLTLVGLGGVGKTRLTSEFAWGLARDPDGVWSDGVWFVPLAGIASHELIVPSIAAALGLGFSGPSEPRRQLLAFLREKTLLLVLDNFEHLLEGGLFVAELLEAAPKVRVIVTSRAALELQGEWIVDLDGLAYPARDGTEALEGFDAVRLFLNRAERLSSRFVVTPDVLFNVAELCRKVEGLPLALELAATWTRTLNVTEIIAELEHGLGLLSTNQRDVPERHRSLRAVFDASWARLSTPEREALSRLSVFHGGFTQAAAQTVAGAHLALLLSLINQSLVRRGQDGRCHLHDLVRQFAGAQLRPTHRSALELRFSHFFLALLGEAEPGLFGPRQAQVRAALLRDVDNLRAACSLAIENQDWETLEASLGGLQAFLRKAGLLDEGRALFEQITQAVEPFASATGAVRLLVRARLYSGMILRDSGRYGEAINHLEFALAALNSPEDARDRARALQALGTSLCLAGRFLESERHLEACRSLSRDLGDDGLLADALLGLAWLRHQLGQNDLARDLLESCLSLREQRGDPTGTALAMIRLAMVLLDLDGDPFAVQGLARRALEISRREGEPMNEVRALGFLALAAYYQGEFVQSEVLLQEAIAIARHLCDVKSQINELTNLADVLNQQGRLEEAHAQLLESLGLCRLVSNESSRFHTFCVLGENASMRGDFVEAKRGFIQAFHVTQRANVSQHAFLSGLQMLASFYRQAGLETEAWRLTTFLQTHPDVPKLIRNAVRTLAEQLESVLPTATLEHLRQEAPLSLETLLERELGLLEI